MDWDGFENALVALYVEACEALSTRREPEGFIERLFRERGEPLHGPQLTMLGLVGTGESEGRLRVPRLSAHRAEVPGGGDVDPRKPAQWSGPHPPVDEDRRHSLEDVLNTNAKVVDSTHRREIRARYEEALVRVARRLEAEVRARLGLGPDFFVVALHADADVTRSSAGPAGGPRLARAVPPRETAAPKRTRTPLPEPPSRVVKRCARWRRLKQAVARSESPIVQDLAAELDVLPSVLAVLLAEGLATDAAPNERIVDALIDALDRGVAGALDAILHHPRTAELEATWRALAYLVEQIDFGENLRLEILNVDAATFAEDLDRDVPIDRTALHAHLYQRAYRPRLYGPKPYGLAIGLYRFGGDAASIGRLARVGELARRAQLTFLSDAAPSMFGLEGDTLEGLSLRLEQRSAFVKRRAPGEAVFAYEEENPRWAAFRRTDASRHVALSAVRYRTRAPYDAQFGGARYREHVERHGEGPPWGSSTVLLAAGIARAFARERLGYRIVRDLGDGNTFGLPDHRAGVVDPDDRRPWRSEAAVTKRSEYFASQQGFILWLDDAHRPMHWSADTCARPRLFENTPEGQTRETNSRLGTQLPYQLVIQRFAQYLQVIRITRLADLRDRAAIERALNEWLNEYVDREGADTYGQRPLRNASVTLEEIEEQAGFRMELRVSLRLLYYGAAFALTTTGWIER